MIITTQPRQSIFDIALQHFGTPEAAFVVADKMGCTITDELTAGVEIEVLSSEILDKRIADYYRQNDIVPATNADLVELGIGTMEIEYDFIIS